MFGKIRKTCMVCLCIISLVLVTFPISSTSVNKISPVKPLNINPDIIEMIQQVNKSELTNHVQTIQDFGPHPTGSETLELVGEYIYNELTTTGLPVEYISWNNEEFSGKNIVATHQGIGSADGIVIVCAHYDSIDVSPGADDDASGVAIVMMLAKIMSNYSFNSTIKFILFSGEEQGKLGSKVYAKNAKNNGDNIVGVLALDKVGYAVTKDHGQKVIHHSNAKSNWMVDVSVEMADKYYEYIGLKIIRKSEDTCSDHKAFVNEGFSGTDFVHYAVNPNYHTSEDKIEHMNMTYLTKVCILTLVTISKTACLNAFLKSSDLKIIMKGTIQSTPAQIYVKIKNKGYELDAVNVKIHVSLSHRFQDRFIVMEKKHYKIPCNWYFTKEIGEYWEFKIGGRTYSRGLVRFEVVVEGINDDIYLYQKQETLGLIIKPSIVFVWTKN
jgi:hypothetical protein